MMVGPDNAVEWDRSMPDRIAQAVLDKYDALPGRGKPQGRTWTVLAGLVAENQSYPLDSTDRLRVLSLATGTRCIGVAAMLDAQGGLVHDCHAEVLCRRAFHRFLLSDIASSVSIDGLASDGLEKCDRILQRSDLVGLESQTTSFPCWRLRRNMKLHFYISTLPCGECTLIPIHSTSEGTLKRATREIGDQNAPLEDRNRTGAKPSVGMPIDPKGDGIAFHCHGILRYKSGRSDTKLESRSVSYSCSEKICRWNHVGWESALLSRLLESPLTMDTIIIGETLFDSNFVHAALFARAEKLIESNSSTTTVLPCPKFYHTNVVFSYSREVIECPSDDASKVSTAGLCVVWCAENSVPSKPTEPSVSRSISPKVSGFYDVLIGHTGERQGLKHDRRSTRDSWISPLCKRVMGHDVVCCLAQALRDPEALIAWLVNKPVDLDIEKPLPKRRRLSQLPTSSLSSTLGVVSTSNHSPITYAWLKGCLTSSGYHERRARFHGRPPFSHWKRKCCLAFSADNGWEPLEVEASVSPNDAFPLDDLPFSLCLSDDVAAGIDEGRSP